MNQRDLVGMRDGDLSPEERRLRDDLVRDDADARADAELAQALNGALTEKLDGGPTLEEVRSKAGASAVRWRVGPWFASLAAAAAAVWMVLPGESVRDRGASAVPVPLSVRLSAVAEGASGVRPLASGGSVGPKERVVFWVDASAPGTLRIVEDQGIDVYPGANQVWRAEVGSQAPGGSQPVAYRPSQPGPHRYTASLCDDSLRCVQHDLTLEWR